LLAARTAPPGENKRPPFYHVPQKKETGGKKRIDNENRGMTYFTPWCAGMLERGVKYVVPQNFQAAAAVITGKPARLRSVFPQPEKFFSFFFKKKIFPVDFSISMA
jgi:hypothetical protein